VAPTKQNRFLVTIAELGGERKDLGVWDSWSGGEVTGEAEQYHAGGEADPTSDVSPGEASEIEITRGYEPARDAPLEKWLERRIGYTFVLGKHPTQNKVPVPGALKTYRARLISVSTPEHDSMGRDWSRIAVRFVPEGLPT
jgi:hypothetical protein